MESTGTGYRITQIILPQRSIPPELFAARSNQLSYHPLVSCVYLSVGKIICTETPVVGAEQHVKSVCVWGVPISFYLKGIGIGVCVSF